MKSENHENGKFMDFKGLLIFFILLSRIDFTKHIYHFVCNKLNHKCIKKTIFKILFFFFFIFKGKYGPTSGQTSTISFNETLAYFQRKDMSPYMVSTLWIIYIFLGNSSYKFVFWKWLIGFLSACMLNNLCIMRCQIICEIFFLLHRKHSTSCTLLSSNYLEIIKWWV